MTIGASKKRKLAVCIAAMLACLCVGAQAQTFRVGDEADEIATIQSALKQLKLYTGEITGHFGAKTETAVMKFQKLYALKDDGVVGDDTLKELYEAAGITASSSASSSSSSASAASSGLLAYGSRSESVRTLQQDLAKLGYYTGSVSGHYGSLTEAAVMSFQRKNGLSADGVAGSKTLAKIATQLGNKNNTTSSTTTAASSGMLKLGTRSDAVRTLQQNLKQLGYYTGSVTGNFGNLTKEAVYNFQKANGLSADGVAGSKTLSAISSKLSGSSSSSSSSSGSTTSGSSSSSSSALKLNTTATLQEGTKNSEEVRKLQTMLTTLEYYSGNVTGNFGTKTKEAIVVFQKAKGLTSDGIAGKRTLAAINADYASGTKKGSSTSGSSSSGSSISTAKAGNVIYDNFYSWRRNYQNGEYCTVYDFSTGLSWQLRIMTKDAHMDAEPVSADDTNIMYKAFGNKTTWTPKAVWVTFSDGKTYLGSTHNVPHTPYHLTNNNFDGHLCVHFPIDMEKANAIGPYATSHQETINEGWAATQKMLR